MDEKERGLEEVEQALSVLAGRDPRAARAEREAREARAKRTAELEAQARRDRTKRILRGVMWGAVGLAVIGVAVVLAGFHLRAKEAEQSLAPAVKPYEKMGFSRAPSPYFSPPSRIEQDVPEDSCVVVVPSPSAKEVRLERPSAPPDVATGTLLHCTCAAEHVIASADAPSAAVALLRIDAKTIGGIFGAAFLEPHPALVTPGGEACAAEHLDAFVASGKFPKSEPSPDWRKGPLAPLEAFGFDAVARVAPDQPLALLEAASDRCFVAAGESGEVGLRVGDKVEVEHARIAWCAPKMGAAMIDRRSAKGPIDVVSAPMRRVGGLFGLTRLVPDAEPYARATDRAAIAAEALHAALVPDVTLVPDGPIPSVPTARVVALSLGLVVQPRGEPTYGGDASSAAYFLCSPPLHAGVREVLCVQNAPQAWHAPGPDVPAGAAYGSLPPWMSAIASIKDPDVVPLELALLELAIRLSARGFEATVIEGITETDDGVTVLGRGGEDAIVAVGIWPAAPWVEPYGEPAWTITKEPTVLPLLGGTRVHLRARDKTTAPLAQRRTVVFRHAAK
jgi:hypothetical protein